MIASLLASASQTALVTDVKPTEGSSPPGSTYV